MPARGEAGVGAVGRQVARRQGPQGVARSHAHGPPDLGRTRHGAVGERETGEVRGLVDVRPRGVRRLGEPAGESDAAGGQHHAAYAGRDDAGTPAGPVGVAEHVCDHRGRRHPHPQGAPEEGDRCDLGQGHVERGPAERHQGEVCPGERSASDDGDRAETGGGGRPDDQAADPAAVAPEQHRKILRLLAFASVKAF
jgi:hypothetical protein